MTVDSEILFQQRGQAGIITLNRPKALNALTRSMVDLVHPQLIRWARDPEIALVIIRANGDKAFCAGGDIRQLHDWGRAGDPAIRAFYHEEYRLNTFIKRYPKPFVALVEGIVMGGGVGLSCHGSHRIAGERIMFAMPETGIGLFPDVGGTWLLPRLPGNLGTWLALTGARLKRADLEWCGLATHGATASQMDEIVEELAARGTDVDACLAAYPASGEGASLPALMPLINRCFVPDSVEAVLDRLDREAGSQDDWPARQAAIIRQKSPTSLKLALRQMQKGSGAEFEDCMRMEYRIVSRVIEGHDFFEGVRAIIIDKDNQPTWRPARLEDVSEADIDAHFAPLDDELDLERLDSL